MQIQLRQLPAWSTALIYFLVLSAAIIIAGTVPFLNSFLFFFLLSLGMSWYFLRLQGKKLASLGALPSSKRHWKQLLAGFAAGIAMLLITAVITVWLTGDRWHLNTRIDPVYILVALLMCVWSAYVQEFVFRGYPFQALVRNYPSWIAQLLIALMFGLMHFSGGMSPQDRASVMLTTGLGSIMFGLAYLRTGNLMLPVGLHLGWNWAQQMVPRTVGGDPKAVLIITGHQISYRAPEILFPYLAVVTLVIFLLYFQPRFPITRQALKNASM